MGSGGEREVNGKERGSEKWGRGEEGVEGKME